ncbi:S-adenosyl-L-methionine-dependent methyltransferase [Hypoxylon trugodes]|uniref:S-adenosyl-L-methionine-dependent methyltransferase n=1 Tax=Hypoxylon trugodes TaxID=326681 RepID=UPI002194085D|nr:S-adenosyl-L-methionine-dependent methyltransferase [Hypoxylon trugodes]KAI1382894.1 S-adenosyl-L-methionine-dependent methyltransferase [Hypoxylon trugodes]
MASSVLTTASFAAEKTFKSYKPEDGAAYARGRADYHENFYRIVVDRHTATGGKLDTILDVGCGPGIAARGLAPHFAHAIGIDASDGMISTARSLGGISSSSEPIRFEISAAEDLGSNLFPPIADSSVDLITAATAAHWFDLSKFWPRAARVLKPGGTVAIWTTRALTIHSSVPNYAAIQAAIDEIKEQYLEPYKERGNHLAGNFYVDLPLPWTLDEPVLDFDESKSSREEWTKERSDDQAAESGLGPRTVTLDYFENRLKTSSPVTRWREAHPDAVGTERDVPRIIRRRVEQLLHEKKGKEEIVICVEAVLLIIKKRV